MQRTALPLPPPPELERLRPLLQQLRLEAAVLERVVYKYKNQHRRAPYFQCLLKVRRDMRLLQEAAPASIIEAATATLEGRNAVPKHGVSARQHRSDDGGKYCYLERLLGVARLISEMTEPVMKAAVQISLLLAKTFFLGFSVVVLALLARIRALIQQILLDVVSVFNKVSDLAHEIHLTKLTSSRIEAFIDHPEAIVLECAWERNNFVLRERTRHGVVSNHHVDEGPHNATIYYDTVDMFHEENAVEDPSSSREGLPDPFTAEIMPESSDREGSLNSFTPEILPVDISTHQPGTSGPATTSVDGNGKARVADQSFQRAASEVNINVPSYRSPSSGECEAGKKVAFVTVRNPAAKEECTTNWMELSKRQKLDNAAVSSRNMARELDDIFASIVNTNYNGQDTATAGGSDKTLVADQSSQPPDVIIDDSSFKSPSSREHRSEETKKVAFVMVRNPATNEQCMKRQKLSNAAPSRSMVDELDGIFTSIVKSRTGDKFMF